MRTLLILSLRGYGKVVAETKKSIGVEQATWLGAILVFVFTKTLGAKYGVYT